MRKRGRWEAGGRREVVRQGGREGVREGGWEGTEGGRWMEGTGLVGGMVLGSERGLGEGGVDGGGASLVTTTLIADSRI